MLKIYNTLGRKLEEFKPIEEGKIRFYQCGPTVYSHQHIGNLSSAVRGDLIRRSLEYLGYEVNYTRNITDVGHLVSDDDEGEDKMEKGSKREGLSPDEIAKKYSDIYHSDLKKLNVLEPDNETIATKYVIQMADMVQALLDKGYAYSTDKAIYFDVDKFDSYNDLNKQDLSKNRMGAGHGSEDDYGKKNPYDFSIWFFKTGVHENALQTWDYEFKGIEQPAKAGFPGWHIECSVMAKDTLGDTLDIHMGGVEHIPVHHTNEIAQSESANGVKYVNYWLHHEMLLIDGGKMSKSLGNVYTLDNLIEKGYDPLVFRYFLLQAHYRSKQNFTFEALDAAKIAYNKLRKFVSSLSKEDGSPVDEEYKIKFKETLEDDFNIPKALAVVWEVTKSDLPDGEKYATLLDFDRVLGLELSKEAVNVEAHYTPEVKVLLEKREAAREGKDWDKSDEIRDKLRNKYKLNVLDTDDGQVIEAV